MKPQKEKMWKKESEQYGKGNIPKDHPDYCPYPYPQCRYHGALLAYKNHVYRCIECGWAIEMEVEKDD